MFQHKILASLLILAATGTASANAIDYLRCPRSLYGAASKLRIIIGAIWSRVTALDSQ